MSSDDFKIASIEFRNFRNYGSLRLENLGDLTIFVGHNGVGKTNILEGIQLVTSTSSFKHPRIEQLLRQGEEYGSVVAHLEGGGRKLDTSLFLEQGKRAYKVNDKPKKAVDVRGILPSIMFNPDDLELAKKTSRVKRDALDALGVQLSRSYYVVRQDYEKVIRYKNKLLKDEAPDSLVDSIDETLITCGSQLYCYRKSLFDRMVDLVASHYGRLSKGQELFSASYVPSWIRECGEDGFSSYGETRDEVKEAMRTALTSVRDEERRKLRSLIGPHNDQIIFYLGGKDVSDYASQGQQRSVVLAWKLAEVDSVKQTTGQNPVLLLDDVMSELDETRRNMLVEFVTEETQTFMTTTDLYGFSSQLLERATVVSLPLESR